MIATKPARWYKEDSRERLAAALSWLTGRWCAAAHRDMHKPMGEGRSRYWWCRTCHREWT